MNRALTSLHGGSLKSTFTVALRKLCVNGAVLMNSIFSEDYA